MDSIRAIWAVQDKIALNSDEEKALELKREMTSGQERVVWNASLALPAKEFVLSDAEIVRVKRAMEMWDSYGADADRRWLQFLVDELFPVQP